MVRVLVVDDERDFTDLLSERLRTRGMEVRTAYNGQEALDVAKTFAPEVVVLDITMPGMSGLEAMDALRTEKPAPEVILLTADTTLGTAVAGMKGGARDYLTKPTDIETLVSAIGEAEGRRMENMSRQRMAETAKLAALGELATGVAHEINNPLQVMLNEVGWIGEVLDEAALEEKSKEQILDSLDLIRHQALRCKAITSKLLTLRCALDAKGATVNLPDLVQDVLDARRAQIERMGVRVEKSWPARLGKLRLPASEWEQLLGNLVDNALDALESTPTEERLLAIQADLEDAEFIISVRDSGCGIEEHLLTRIFEPFFSTKEVGKGIGLGLAICHGIIEAMGGNISVRSTPGRGSTFTTKVPMAVHAHNEHNGPEDPASAKEE
ncbi:MAG: response regulator [Desulfomicrobium sp.]